MKTHFRHARAHWFTVTEVAMLCSADAKSNPRTATLVFQSRQPSIKFI